VPQRRRGPVRGGAVVLKIPSHEAICEHGRDDTERRTPFRSPRRSWARSRCRCPDRTLPDRCQEYPPTVAVAVASLTAPMAGPTDTLPADHRFHRSDIAAATAILWTSVPAGSPPIGHSYVLQNSALRRAAALKASQDQYATHVSLFMRGCIAVLYGAGLTRPVRRQQHSLE